ncbi:MAG: hypothetical protein R3Y56_09545 [Akkermansia sp.]
MRSLALIFSFIVGSIFYESLTPLRWVIPYSIGMMLFLTFVGVEKEKLKPHRLHVKLLIGIQISGFIFWLIPSLLGYPILAESMFYCAAAPIAAAAPIIISILKGKVEFITTALLLSQFIFALLMPIVLPFIVPGSHASYWDISSTVFLQLFQVIICPAVLALIVRCIYPKSITWRGKTSNLALGLWVFNLCVITGSSVTNIIAFNYSLMDMLPFVLASALICAVGFTVGYQLGKPDYAVEFSQGLGQKNTLLTLLIASQEYSTPIACIGPTFYIIFHNIANAIQVAIASHKEKKSQKQTS